MVGKLQKIELPPKHLNDYKQIIKETVDEIEKLRKAFADLSVIHLSATSTGGGVSEILHSMVPLQNDIGIKSSWYVLSADQEFFTITKKIHNLLQGKNGELSKQEKKYYLTANEEFTKQLRTLSADILIVHDPQPAAVIHFLKQENHSFKKILWRCHLDSSSPNVNVWEFLSPFLSEYDKLIFSMKAFANNAFEEKKISIITPGIDPLIEKNIPMPFHQAKEYVESVGVDTNAPVIVQVSRFDPWKDPLGVIDVYRKVKRDFPQLQLVFLGQIASDDPEGIEILKQIKNVTQKDKDIFIFTDFDVRGVNAFQTASDVVLQKSLKEGFGLTVTEAMWKKMIVLGGNVGGIALQIEDGINGYLASTNDEAAKKISEILKSPKSQASIREKAHETVRKNYLIPHKLADYLRLFARLHLH